MIRKLKIAAKILREEGPAVLAHRTRRFFGKRVLGWQQIALSVASEDVLAADWTKAAPNVRASAPKAPLKISWVLPPIGISGGGHQNILRFVRFLESKGHHCKIYFYDPQKIQTQLEVDSIIEHHYPPMRAEVLVGLETLVDSDAILATSWQTAYPVFNSKTAAKKFYFVQDYEPYFYPVNTESVLAENTYRFGFYGITAGKWLQQKLSQDFAMACDYYDFGSDSGRYIYQNDRPRRKVLFYARPVTPRRGFEMGVLALELFAKAHPEYEINLVGWDIGEYKLPFKFVNHGALKLDQLNDLYNQAAAALVLSFTNMSLLPLELLSAGCIPVVNDAPNNRLVSDNPYIAYTAAAPAALAERLGELVVRSDLPIYAQKAASSVQELDWDKSGDKFVSILERELHG